MSFVLSLMSDLFWRDAVQVQPDQAEQDVGDPHGEVSRKTDVDRCDGGDFHRKNINEHKSEANGNIDADPAA